MNLSDKKYMCVWAVLGALIVSGVLLKILPIASENVFFILGIPLIFIFLVAALVDLKFMLVILLFSRALLDPILNATKITIMGESVGIGGGLNFLVICFTVLFLMKKPAIFTRNPLSRRWMIYLAVCLVAVLYSPVKGRAARLFLNLVSYLCIASWPLFLIHNEDEQKKWIYIILCSSVLPTVLALADLLLGGVYDYSLGMRIKGTFTHPNILAFYLVFIITLTFYILQSPRFTLTRFRVNALRLYMMVLFMLLAATRTRSAWISCWSFFFLYGLLKQRRYLVYVFLIPPLFFLHPEVFERVRELFSLQRYNIASGLNSLAWRLELWRSSVPWLMKRLAFGWGLASFEPLSENFFVLAKEQGVPAHNTYLELIFETGMAGLISYVSIYIFVLRKYFRQMRARAGTFAREFAIAFCYVTSYLLVCLADNMLYYLAFNWYFWFFAGSMLRLIQLEDETNRFSYRSVV